MPNKDRPLVDRHPPKPGEEGWLVNAQEQLVVQFKPDNPTAHAECVSGDLQLDSATAAGAEDTSMDAQAQRN